MRKITKLIGIFAVAVIAIVYTIGSIGDLLFDTGIAWLDWRLFVVIPVWLVVIIVSFMIIGISISGFSTKVEPFMQEIDAYGKLLNIETVIETELWQTKWPKVQALGREFSGEKDAIKQQELFQTLKQEMIGLGEELVTQNALDSGIWMKLRVDMEEFELKVKNQTVNFFDQMYLNWLFSDSSSKVA